MCLVPRNGRGRVCEHTLPVRMMAWCRASCARPLADFRDLLLEDCEEKFISLREAEGIGRPLGTAGFVTELERRLGRPIARRAPGRKAVTIPVGGQLNLLQ